MPDTLHLDFETASDVDLTKVGLDVYSQPSSNPRVLMAAYRINGSEPQHWEAHKRKLPAELAEALADPEVHKWAFMAQFERVITNRVLRVKSPRKGWRCSMCLAYFMSFLGGLEDVGEQIGLPADRQKLRDGRRLVRKFTIPQKLTKNQPNQWRNWITDPDEWEEFCEYNKQDLIAEEAVKHRLIRYPIPDWRWEDYELDQLVNDRGIPADRDFIENLIWMSEKRKSELLLEIKLVTHLANPNAVLQLTPWLQDRGYPFSDIRKESVVKALALMSEENYPEVIKVLRLRQWAARTSVAKALTAKSMMGAGDRLRYQFQFAGAQRTNRFAGRGVQPQNMTVTPKLLDPEENDEKLRVVTNIIRDGDYEAFELMLQEPMEALTGCMRSMFRVDSDDKVFRVCDLKSIESAVIGWVSRCQRLLQVFRDGKDPYKDFGTEFYKKAYDDITRAERTICKPPTLGCGFRLSGGQVRPDGSKTGLLAYAENMGVQMTWEEAKRAVEVFRKTYFEIPDFWQDCEDATNYVIRTKKPKKVGFVTFEWMKPFVLIRLPSGRYIYYFKPRLEPRIVYTGRMKTAISKGPDYWDQYPDSFGVPAGEPYTYEESYKRLSFTYMGKNQKTTRWDRLDGHGGVTTENIVQAIAYDVLMVKLRRMHQEGFQLVMHAHDEGVAVVRRGDNRLTLGLLTEIFREPISWAPGLPLGASSWQGEFYRK